MQRCRCSGPRRSLGREKDWVRLDAALMRGTAGTGHTPVLGERRYGCSGSGRRSRLHRTTIHGSSSSPPPVTSTVYTALATHLPRPRKYNIYAKGKEEGLAPRQVRRRTERGSVAPLLRRLSSRIVARRRCSCSRLKRRTGWWTLH